MKFRKPVSAFLAAAMILPLAACEERPVETVGTTTTAAIVTTAATTTKAEATTEATTTAETAAETTTIPDNNPPGHFGVFPGYIMLDGMLLGIYPLDAYVLIETEDGYAGTSSYYDSEKIASILTEENFRGVSEKVTDEAEKNGTIDLIRNELETDFDDGMNVYFNGKSALLLIPVSDSSRIFYFDWEEMEAVGETFPYPVSDPEPGRLWYGFMLDPGTERMLAESSES